MAESAVPKIAEYNGLTITDGSGTPLSYPLTEWAGQVSYSDPQAERIVIYDQRAISAVIKGKDPVITGSFTVHARSFADASSSSPTILDLIYGTNTWSTKTSTAAASFSNFKLVDLAFSMEGTDFGDAADHVATFSDCHLAYDFASGQPNTITISFECYGGLTRTGPTGA